MSRPVMEWWSGSVRVTEWPDEKATEQKGYVVQTFKIERRCKNLKGDWHSSSVFFKRDLLDLVEVCRVIHERLSVRERSLAESGEKKTSAEA